MSLKNMATNNNPTTAPESNMKTASTTTLTNSARKLMEDIKGGRLITLDGGTGTELDNRGAVPPWSAKTRPAQLHSLKVLEDVHDSYINSGASVIIANTYTANLSFMGSQLSPEQDAEEEVEKTNIEGVRIAKKCVEKSSRAICVAGSMGNLQASVTNESRPSQKEEYANYLSQAKILEREGVDFIFLEMLKEKLHASLLVRAVSQVEVPVFVGLTLSLNSSGQVCMRDDHDFSVKEAIQTFTSFSNVVGVNIMHCDVDNMDAYIEAVKAHWSGPLGVYPNQGTWSASDYVYTARQDIESKDLVKKMSLWKDKGVSLFGGCCGFGPRYIQAISNWVAEENGK